MTAANNLAIRHALEAAGVEFIDENGGGPGVACARVFKRNDKNSASLDVESQQVVLGETEAADSTLSSMPAWGRCADANSRAMPTAVPVRGDRHLLIPS